MGYYIPLAGQQLIGAVDRAQADAQQLCRLTPPGKALVLVYAARGYLESEVIVELYIKGHPACGIEMGRDKVHVCASNWHGRKYTNWSF